MFSKQPRQGRGLLGAKPVCCAGRATSDRRRRRGLEIAVRSGGHNLSGGALDEQGLIIDLPALTPSPR